MERSEFINSISDALTEVLGKEVYGVVNSIKDHKFPVFVVHSITLQSFDNEFCINVQRRVNSRETDKEVVFRSLMKDLMVLLLRRTLDGALPIEDLKIKF